MIGVVLSGGGTKGAFQAGVIAQLGLKPDLVVGTSIGAINAMVWNFKGQDEMAKTWHSVDSRSDWLGLNWSHGFLDGIYHSKPLRKWLDDVWISGTPRFKSYACRVDMTTGALEYVPHDSIRYTDAVVDSGTVPVAMRPEAEYVDGGVREKVPLRFAVGAGCDEIHVVMCNPIARDPEHAKMPRNPLSMIMRTVDILTHEGQNDDIKRASRGKNVRFYAPEKPLYDTFCFDGKLLKDAFRQGLEAKSVSPEELSDRLCR